MAPVLLCFMGGLAGSMSRKVAFLECSLSVAPVSWEMVTRRAWCRYRARAYAHPWIRVEKPSWRALRTRTRFWRASGRAMIRVMASCWARLALNLTAPLSFAMIVNLDSCFTSAWPECSISPTGRRASSSAICWPRVSSCFVIGLGIRRIIAYFFVGWPLQYHTPALVVSLLRTFALPLDQGQVANGRAPLGEQRGGL